MKTGFSIWKFRVLFFRQTMGSLYAAECGIPMELKHRLVDRTTRFFNVEANRRNLIRRITPGMSERSILLEMMGVTANVDSTIEQMLLSMAGESVSDVTTIIDKFEEYGFSKFFWEEIKVLFGYAGQESVKDLMIVLFRDDMDRFHMQPKLQMLLISLCETGVTAANSERPTMSWQPRLNMNSAFRLNCSLSP